MSTSAISIRAFDQKVSKIAEAVWPLLASFYFSSSSPFPWQIQNVDFAPTVPRWGTKWTTASSQTAGKQGMMHNKNTKQSDEGKSFFFYQSGGVFYAEIVKNNTINKLASLDAMRNWDPQGWSEELPAYIEILHTSGFRYGNTQHPRLGSTVGVYTVNSKCSNTSKKRFDEK